jgi:hypothetical protein
MVTLVIIIILFMIIDYRPTVYLFIKVFDEFVVFPKQQGMSSKLLKRIDTK